MFNLATNMYIFMIFTATLAFELLITKLINVSAALPWGFTIGIYFLFLLSQVLMKMNEDAEKNKVKNLLFELMDTIDGIPVMNKNERLIIKWDIVFKKLVDFKEFGVYDKIIKIKAQHIDNYVNKYPSLLVDDSVDMRKAKYNMDLNSTIKNRNKRNEDIDEELAKDEDCKKKLFITDIKNDRMTFSNYNSSIYMDVMMINEYVTEDSGIENNPDYDGFSIWIAYKDNKYNIVPRVMVHKKLINKSKWFVDNINALLESATSIANGDYNNILYIDNYKLIDYLEDMPDKTEESGILEFKQLKNEVLVFMGVDKDNKAITAFCEFKTGYNRFEVILKSIQVKDGDKLQTIDIEKTVAIGSGFQPIITLLEKMPELIKNIELIISNQDIVSIVIS